MSEFRQSIATKEWVIIATERSMRPRDFIQDGRPLTDQRPSWDAGCPFCPGNEEPPPSEQMRLPNEGPWQVRIVLNKYPAVRAQGDRVRRFDGIERRLPGVGRHEVLVEAPQHNTTVALMDPADIALVFAAMQSRAAVYAADPRIEQIMLFENHGPRAGTSLDHPHAQLIALPVVPHTVRHRSDEALRHFDDTGHCVFCDIWDGEVGDGERLITQNEHFAAFIPYAASAPFHTWVLPQRHVSSFLNATPAELTSLAVIMKDVLHRLYVGLRDPDYNFIVRTAPVRAGEQKYLHWYVTIVPRLSQSAGFELGSGMYINTALPEESAAFLRSLAA